MQEPIVKEDGTKGWKVNSLDYAHQVFKNTHHHKIRFFGRSQREVFGYGVENHKYMRYGNVFRKVFKEAQKDACHDNREVLELYKATHFDCWAVAEHISSDWTHVDVCIYNIFGSQCDFD